MGAQGLKGAVKVKVFTETPGALPCYGALHDARPVSRSPPFARQTGRGGDFICRHHDRNAAEALKGTELFVARAALPRDRTKRILPCRPDRPGSSGQRRPRPGQGRGHPQLRRRRCDRNRPRRRRQRAAGLHPRDRADIDIAAGASSWRCRKTMRHDHVKISLIAERACRVAGPRGAPMSSTCSLPEMFPGPLGISLLGKAMTNDLWSLEVRDIRDHGLGKHRTVDDTPAGGGPGMVMRADVAAAAIDAVERGGAPVDLSVAARRAADPGAGARAGVRARRGAALRPFRRPGRAGDRGARGSRKSRLGDFVLAGGEIAAMALIEASVRLIPGVLGDHGLHRGGKLRRGPAGISPFHPAAIVRGPAHPGCPNPRKSQGNFQMAAGAGRRPDPGPPPGPLDPL